MRAAVARILGALDSHERIVLFGDYDVDGVTSLALLAEMLRGYGATPELFLPLRMEEGYGLSRDSVERHAKFREKEGLDFPLVSDEDGKITEAWGVWREKSNYGRKYMGIARATFLIDEKGKIAQIWDPVRVPGHVDKVMAAIKELHEA